MALQASGPYQKAHAASHLKAKVLDLKAQSPEPPDLVKEHTFDYSRIPQTLKCSTFFWLP